MNMFNMENWVRMIQIDSLVNYLITIRISYYDVALHLAHGYAIF